MKNSFIDNSGNEYYTKGSISCTTENVVYGVHCKKCEKLMYVGETMNSLYLRHVKKFSLIRNNTKIDDITYHFTNVNNHSLLDYQIVGIEKIFREDNYRKTREQFWIKKLKTLRPHGLNVKSC